MAKGSSIGFRISVFIPLLSAAVALLIAGCGAKEQPPGPSKGGEKKTEAKGEGKKEDHKEGEHKEGEGKGHEEHKGEAHGKGWLIDIGEHTFLGDVDFDAEEGTLSLTVLDHHDRKPYAHKTEEVQLNLVFPDGTKQLKMKAAPAEGDPEGKTTRYTITDPALKGVKEIKGRVNLTIDGKTYVCDLAAAH
ncbi:MAG: hypothetical protein ACYTHM_01295 [Planctomycetota bacterium]|jgi:hypothetical protein